MAEFFPRRGDGGYGLALFLNAGDPPLPVLEDLVHMLDERGVECLELAVPFPDSVTDGPTIRRSARRALDAGVELADVLAFVERVRPGLHRLRIALLADWSHSVKPRPLADVVGEVAGSGVDGLLLHALPPRLRTDYHAAAADAGLPIVTTCYHGVSSPRVLDEAAANASAYLYLVAHYGRSGTSAAPDLAGLAGTVATLRERTAVPIAVGFGVRTRQDAESVAGCGADAVIVGSAGVARVENALSAGRDVVADFEDFVSSIAARDGEYTQIRTGG
ncbi:tryptophan synthase subunit alpha [Actinophytocola gossypii]|uniref:tryptophan synthase n=1 Tax=Actinophytocola gossypii TaxID=2812003 RepID=A0ABT2J296_9PSEU|nr:tryptophan synthase subunit alpha [Actinophytocola gossypii]MCT2581977.1 tryptophan synthase subunit alpha [Actinophytocola gossypii]